VSARALYPGKGVTGAAGLEEELGENGDRHAGDQGGGESDGVAPRADREEIEDHDERERRQDDDMAEIAEKMHRIVHSQASRPASPKAKCDIRTGADEKRLPAAAFGRLFLRTLRRGSLVAQQWRAPTPAARSVKPILVKLYGRRRLFDAEKRRYVSIAQPRNWAVEGVAFVVRDAETGLDVTRVLLA
jgi:hypothetical protein